MDDEVSRLMESLYEMCQKLNAEAPQKVFCINREAYLKNQVLGMCNGIEPLRGGCIKDFLKTTTFTIEPDVISGLYIKSSEEKK